MGFGCTGKNASLATTSLLFLPRNPSFQHVESVSIQCDNIGAISRAQAAQKMPKPYKFCGISGSEAEGIIKRDLEHVHAIADRRGHVECRAG